MKLVSTHPILRDAEGVEHTLSVREGDVEVLGALDLAPVSPRDFLRGGNRRVVKVRVSIDPADAPVDAREESGSC